MPIYLHTQRGWRISEPDVSFDMSRCVIWQGCPDVAEESSTVVESEVPTGWTYF